MNKQMLKQRMKLFALRIIRMVEMMPETQTAKVIGNQILRSATSIGANYVACCRSKSTKDFIFRIPEVIEYITKYLTLFPGDVISTGTVEGISPVKPGDIMTCEVEGVGILVNKVVLP